LNTGSDNIFGLNDDDDEDTDISDYRSTCSSNFGSSVLNELLYEDGEPISGENEFNEKNDDFSIEYDAALHFSTEDPQTEDVIDDLIAELNS